MNSERISQARKRVSNGLDQQREVRIPERRVRFTQRNLLIAALFIILFGSLALNGYQAYLNSNPRVKQLSAICLDDPRYQGLQGCMYVEGVQGDSSDGLSTAIFIGEMDFGFFGPRAQDH